MKYLLLFCLFVFVNAVGLRASLDSVRTDEIVVTANRAPSLYSENARIIQTISRADIESAPVQSLSDLLEYTASVDVRQRGNIGVQADIGIRGGTYDQALILLNGIPVNDPQTGHHNMNLPIDIYDIERIEILEGPGARVLGVNAFTGAINIITTNAENNNFRVNLNGGEFGFYRVFSSVAFNINKLKSYFSVSKSASDGYIDNTDFKNLNIFSQQSLNTDIADFNLQIGYNDKEFGANSFYTAAFPNQFEAVRGLFGALSFSSGHDINLTGNIYARQHTDRFELFRDNPAEWYSGHNYHKTNIYGGLLKLNIKWSPGITSIGTDIRQEGILSNVLGDLMDEPVAVSGASDEFYTREANRNNIGFFVDHTLSYNKFTASAGIFMNWNSDWDWNTYYGIDLNYKINPNLAVFGNINQSTRLPNFTDLYYEGPTNRGNPSLIPENANTYEVGAKYFNDYMRFSASVFARFGENLIDWTRLSDTLLWQTMNVSEVNTKGLSISTNIYPHHINEFPKFWTGINLSYQYLHSEKSSGEYLSFYNLDHLKHKFAISSQFNFIENLFMDIRLSYQSRVGTFYNYKLEQEVPYEDITLLDFKMYYNWNKIRIFTEVSNIMNQIYQDLGNVYLPGRWLRFGVEFRTGF
ncbi:MAG: TonB-dependent receptor [Candidatus Kapabacteria bacterium]|nr:TonB-dependent receptor [Candidatus Kapabacteria bacterium]